MSMLTMEAVALDLLEYKLDDLRASRRPKGGRDSVWALYKYLRGNVGALDVRDKRRFEELEGTLRRYGEVGKAERRVASLDTLTLQDVRPVTPPPPPAPPALSESEVEEQRVLRRLASRVWWHETRRGDRTLGGDLPRRT